MLCQHKVLLLHKGLLWHKTLLLSNRLLLLSKRCYQIEDELMHTAFVCLR